MRILVLGAAAGGGFPQWNCNCDACRRARAGDPNAQPATQASIAITADDEHWFVVNASPDLREQVNRHPQLQPQVGLRSSPIAGVILTNADVDAIAGLLHLRERTALVVYAHPRVLEVLDRNPIFGALAPDLVQRVPFRLGEPITIVTPRGEDSGLRVTPFPVPGKVALYLEDESDGPDLGTRQGDTIGLDITNAACSARLSYIANCAEVSEGIVAHCTGADLVFFDGSFWRDDEMIKSTYGHKTGRRMGHVSMSGPEGSIETFDGVTLARKLFIHINNTNPALLSDSVERQAVLQSGWEVAYDGMEIVLQ